MDFKRILFATVARMVRRPNDNAQATVGLADSGGGRTPAKAVNDEFRARRIIPLVDDSMYAALKAGGRRLNVVERGRLDGVDNLPPTSDTTPNETQAEIIAIADAGAKTLRRYVIDGASSALAAIQSAPVEELDGELLLARCQAAASRVKVDNKDRLKHARLDERRAWRELVAFRMTNRREHAAAYADRWGRPIMLMVAMTVGEAIANAALFANGSNGGLFEGFITAGLFSITNVALGFAGGFFGLRYMGHVDRMRRMVIGWGALAASIGLGAWFNLAVIRYRDALSHDASASFAEAAANGVSPHDLAVMSSTNSLLLMLVGLLVFVLALVKGRGGRSGFVDPYPDYRAHDRHYREEEGAYRLLRDQFSKEIDKPHDEASAEVAAFGKRNADRLANARAIRLTTERNLLELRDSITEFTQVANNELRSYREHNAKVRSTQAPAYFKQMLSYEHITQDVPSLREMDDLIKAYEDIHRANQAVAATIERTLASRRRDDIDNMDAEVEATELQVEASLERTLRFDFDKGGPPSAVAYGLSESGRA